MFLLLSASYHHVVSEPHCCLLLLEAAVYGLMALVVRLRHAWVWIGYMLMMTLLLANVAVEAGALAFWFG